LTPRAPWRRPTRRLDGAAFVPWPTDSAIGSNCVTTSDDSLPPSGPTLQHALEALITAFDERAVRYAIIGGVAVIQHTRIRTTDDIDALLTVPQLEMPGLFENLARRGFVVDVLRNVRELRDDGFTTIRFGDVVIDLLRPVIPAYAHVLDRAVSANLFGRTVRVSSAEGLIVMKLIAMRPQDQADVQDLLRSYGDRLDLDFVRAELDTFTDPEDPRRATFEQWVRESAAGGTPEQDGPG
jgi:predicted nucleotidyltransferase